MMKKALILLVQIVGFFHYLQANEYTIKNYSGEPLTYSIEYQTFFCSNDDKGTLQNEEKETFSGPCKPKKIKFTTPSGKKFEKKWDSFGDAPTDLKFLVNPTDIFEDLSGSVYKWQQFYLLTPK